MAAAPLFVWFYYISIRNIEVLWIPCRQGEPREMDKMLRARKEILDFGCDTGLAGEAISSTKLSEFLLLLSGEDPLFLAFLPLSRIEGILVEILSKTYLASVGSSSNNTQTDGPARFGVGKGRESRPPESNSEGS